MSCNLKRLHQAQELLDVMEGKLHLTLPVGNEGWFGHLHTSTKPFPVWIFHHLDPNVLLVIIVFYSYNLIQCHPNSLFNSSRSMTILFKGNPQQLVCRGFVVEVSHAMWAELMRCRSEELERKTFIIYILPLYIYVYLCGYVCVGYIHI